MASENPFGAKLVSESKNGITQRPRRNAGKENFGFRISDLAKRSAVGLAEGLRKRSVASRQVSVVSVSGKNGHYRPARGTRHRGCWLEQEWLAAGGQRHRVPRSQSAIRNPKFFPCVPQRPLREAFSGPNLVANA